MGVYERLTADDDTKIAVHTFGAALREVARGNATLNQVINLFNLDAAAQTELTAIRDAYLALSTDLERAQFMMQMEDAFILSEAGIYNKTQVKNALGF
jgi:hypothetical protein